MTKSNPEKVPLETIKAIFRSRANPDNTVVVNLSILENMVDYIDLLESKLELADILLETNRVENPENQA
jgi:hypothetical protein